MLEPLPGPMPAWPQTFLSLFRPLPKTRSAASAAAAAPTNGSARVLQISVTSNQSDCANKIRVGLVKRDLRKLLKPLDGKAKSSVEAGPCVAASNSSGAGGASYDFVATVTTKEKDSAGAARVLLVSAEINNDFASAMPRTTKALDAASGTAAWQLSHVVELAMGTNALATPDRIVSIDLGSSSQAKNYTFTAGLASARRLGLPRRRRPGGRPAADSLRHDCLRRTLHVRQK